MKRYTNKEIDSYNSLLFEGFMLKDIDRALVLVSNILGRRLGTNINIGTLSNDFDRSEGSFTGVYGMMNDGKAIRFNFSIGKTSGDIKSIDIWYKPAKYPDITIDTEGFNIIQIMDEIVVAIQEKTPQNIMILTEKQSPITDKSKKSINDWIKADGIETWDMENKRISNLYNEYTFWYSNLSDEEVKEYKAVSKSTFFKAVGDILKKNNLVNKFSKQLKVTKASKEVARVNKTNEAKFKKSLYNMSLDDWMELVKTNLQAVIQGYKKSVLISGTAGIGKTKNVLDELKASGQKYEYISGGLKDARSLYMLLHDNNKKDLILVFDDINNLFRNKEATEILRVATTNDNNRQISFVDSKIEKNKKYKSRINFESKIIIITNIPIKKIDKAIVSRTSAIEVNPSKQDILDSIRVNLEEAPPQGVPIEWKMEVFQWMDQEIGVKDITRIDFRVFEQALIWKACSPDSSKWKKFAYTLIR